MKYEIKVNYHLFLLFFMLQDECVKFRNLMMAVATALQSEKAGALIIHSTHGLNRNWAVWIMFCLLLNGADKFNISEFTRLESKFPVRLNVHCIAWVTEFMKKVPIIPVRGIAAYCERFKRDIHFGGGESGCVVQ